MKKINSIISSVLISFVLAGALGFVALQTSPALALMIKLGLEDLSKEADFILRGEVTEVRSEWSEDKTVIYTYITLTVKERIAGQYEAETVTIKQLGGEVDGIGMSVSDSAVFKKGEDAIVFLKPDRSQQAVRLQQAGRGVITEIVGKEQGKYTVAEDEVTGTQAITVNKGTFGTKTGQMVTGTGKMIPLEDFVGQIKKIKEERQ